MGHTGSYEPEEPPAEEACGTRPASDAIASAICSRPFRENVHRRPVRLGHHDLVAYELSDGRAMIRPSGTEPKCKIYVDLRAKVGAADDLDARTAELTAEAAIVAQNLARFSGPGAAPCP